MNGRFIRRNRVDERLASAIAAGSGLAAVLAGAAPTGSSVVDAVLVFLSVGLVVWASASAQWWAVASAAGIGAVIALEPLAAALGALGFLAGLNIGTWRRDQTAARGLVGGVAANVLVRSEADVFFGFSAIVGISVCVALIVLGLLRRPSRVRTVAWQMLLGVGVLGAAAVVAVGVAGTAARPDLTDGASAARRGVTALNKGDYEAAAGYFEQASDRFTNSDGQLNGLLAAPAKLVPGIAQNVRAGADLSEAAAEATAVAAGALRQIDVDSLVVTGGTLDIDAVSAVRDPLLRVNQALTDLRRVVDDVDSPWLVGPVQAELTELDEEFAENQPRLGNAIEAVRLAPSILGADGTRRYLILFTTPSEARGLGGFVGSYAVLEVTDGRLSVAAFQRTAFINDALDGTDCSECPDELLTNYGAFGYTTGDDDTVGKVLLSNATMPAHFPYVGQALDILYPQGFDEEIDGVIALDPYVVQALMSYSGPIEVPALETTVRPQDAAQFILHDQYLVADDKGERIEALDALGTGAIAAILSGSLPDPTVVARDLGPLVSERRLLMWTEYPDEQALLDRIGMLGSIPDLDPRDGGFSVAVTNASANKIDYFLEREVDVWIDESGGQRRLIADVTLTNTAPSSGLPPYVIGNQIDLPDGHSRLFVTFFGPAQLVEAVEVGGDPLMLQVLPEAGWTGFSNYFDFAPGETRQFQLTFALTPRAPGDDTPVDPAVWDQPLSSRPDE